MISRFVVTLVVRTGDGMKCPLKRLSKDKLTTSVRLVDVSKQIATSTGIFPITYIDPIDHYSMGGKARMAVFQAPLSVDAD
jgi:hypothetical protein